MKMRVLMTFVAVLSILVIVPAQLNGQPFETSEQNGELSELMVQIKILETLERMNFSVEQLEKFADTLFRAKGEVEKLTTDRLDLLREYKDALLARAGDEELERLRQQLREVEKRERMVHKKLESDLKNILTVAQYEMLLRWPVEPMKPVPPPPPEGEHMPPEKMKEKEHLPPEGEEMSRPYPMPTRVPYALPVEFILSDIFLRTLEEYINAVRGL